MSEFNSDTLCLGAVFLLALFLVPSVANACSLILTIEDDDSRVLVIGKVRGLTSEVLTNQYVNGETIERQEVYGVVVEPIQQFGSAESDREAFRIFPSGISADCSAVYETNSERLESRFKPGQLVTVIGYERPGHSPGDLILGLESGLVAVADECTAKRIAEHKIEYPIETEICGPALFHTYKDIARLPAASEQEATGILARLSQVRYFIEYEALINKYVSDAAARIVLMRLRYADAMKIGCAVEPELVPNYDEGFLERREKRSRWFEYCTSERRKVAKANQ